MVNGVENPMNKQIQGCFVCCHGIPNHFCSLCSQYRINRVNSSSHNHSNNTMNNNNKHNSTAQHNESPQQNYSGSLAGNNAVNNNNSSSNFGNHPKINPFNSTKFVTSLMRKILMMDLTDIQHSQSSSDDQYV